MSDQDHLHKVQVVVKNDAKFPIAELAILHSQDAGGHQGPTLLSYAYKQPSIESPSTVENSIYAVAPLSITFDVPITYESDHDSYWIVAWRNMHDPVVYYLVNDLSFWQQFALDAIKEIDSAIGGVVDLFTDSPVGTVGAVAANAVVQKIFDMHEGHARIENKVDTDTETSPGSGINVFQINLPCGRTRYLLESGGHTTNCSTQTYSPGTSNRCHSDPPLDPPSN